MTILFKIENTTLLTAPRRPPAGPLAIFCRGCGLAYPQADTEGGPDEWWARAQTL